MSAKVFPSPLGGISSLLQLWKTLIDRGMKKFPSPLEVISFLRTQLTLLHLTALSFPSPLGGISFFTVKSLYVRKTRLSFRPLSGLSLFLRSNGERWHN